MKCGLLGAIAFLLTGAGWVAAQAPAPTLPAPSPQPPRTTMPAGLGYPVAGDTQGGIVGLSQPAPVADGPGYLPPETLAGCNSGPVFYADADYLLYRFRTFSIPTTAQTIPVGLIAVTINNTTTTPGAVPPTTTQSSTNFLPVSIVNNAGFGNGRIDFSSQNGGRLALGFWVDKEQTWGLEARGELVERGVDPFAAVSGFAPNPLVINTGLTQTQTLILTTGAVGQTVTTSTPIVLIRQAQASLVGSAANSFYSGELNAKGVFLRVGCVDFGGLVGFRYLRYEEELGINTVATLVKPAGFPDTTGTVVDPLSQNVSFNTTNKVRAWNQFYGAQTGLEIDMKFGSFFLDVRGTLGLGDMHQVADVGGATTIMNNDPAHPSPASSVIPGGLLAGPTDLGQHSRDRFSYLPEVNAKVGCQLTSWFRVWVGYDGLLIGHAAGASQSTVTNSLNTSISVAGSSTNVNIAQPAFRFSDRDVWVQGATFGCELRY
jgi:hypothetical protein